MASLSRQSEALSDYAWYSHRIITTSEWCVSFIIHTFSRTLKNKKKLPTEKHFPPVSYVSWCQHSLHSRFFWKHQCFKYFLFLVKNVLYLYFAKKMIRNATPITQIYWKQIAHRRLNSQYPSIEDSICSPFSKRSSYHSRRVLDTHSWTAVRVGYSILQEPWNFCII